MVLCDTNIFIHAFNGNADTINELTNIGFDNIVVSAITIMELYQGMGNKNEMIQMRSRMRSYDVIEIDTAISQLSVSLIDQFNLSHGLLIPDAIIGATAIVHQIPLFTYNLKDFRFMPDIQLHKQCTTL